MLGKIARILFFGLVVLGPVFGSSQVISAPEAAPQTPPPERKIEFDSEDLKNPEDWKRIYFDVVIVINKAVNAQSMNVYRHGILAKSSSVSTGRESSESNRTPVGYFTVGNLESDSHAEGKSRTWTVSFGDNFISGTPFEHGQTDEFDRNIGHRSSEGEIRLHESDAKDLFWLVRSTGDPFTPAEMKAHNSPVESELASSNGLFPYQESQVVADVAVEGSLVLNADKIVKTHYGARSLVVVVNNPLRVSPASSQHEFHR